MTQPVALQMVAPGNQRGHLAARQTSHEARHHVLRQVCGQPYFQPGPVFFKLRDAAQNAGLREVKQGAAHPQRIAAGDGEIEYRPGEAGARRRAANSATQRFKASGPVSHGDGF